jgi:hypothetical protein
MERKERVTVRARVRGGSSIRGCVACECGRVEEEWGTFKDTIEKKIPIGGEKMSIREELT